MSRFINTSTQVIVSVADEKDDRFGEGWELVKDEVKPEPKQSKK